MNGASWLTAPRRWVESLIGSLSLTLFLWLFAVIVLAFSAYATVSIRTTSRQWDESVQQWAQRFSDVIQSSTHHGMLLNRKEDVHHTIRAVASSPGVETVRVLDKTGRITFSADAAEIGRSVDLQAEACVTCHRESGTLEAVPDSGRARIFERADGRRVLGLIEAIENAPECSSAACHAHPPSQRVLGVLDVTMSMAEPDARLAATRRQLLLGGMLTALAAGVGSALFIVRMVRRPVRQLIRGTTRVASGDLATEIPVERDDEIGRLAGAFNAMTRDLRRAREELTQWSELLETRLREQTEALGQSQRQVAQMDKMASLGKLAATVAHELNNPLAGILNYAKLVERTLRDAPDTLPEREELGRWLALIEREAARSGAIVRNLLTFARRSGTELALTPLNPLLERAAMLIRHHLEIANVRLELDACAGDDGLVCDADQLQQALVALLVNAVEAMPEGGTLRLAAEGRPDEMLLTVADTGHGIPESARAHIFEPFFSSKQDTGGVGLGLAVVYGIVQRHAGRIDVESEVGRGTTFRIVLPRRPAEAAPAG